MLKRQLFTLIRYVQNTIPCAPSATFRPRYCSDKSKHITPMDLKDVCKGLRRLASPTLAGSWDNVGLLVEPSAPHTVSSMLLTNDLTEAVMEEAITTGVQLIMAYHPPIFSPLKRLTQASWKERIVIKCVEQRIAVYSPHTALDAVPGGVNDWLMQPFQGEVSCLESQRDSAYARGGAYRLEFTSPCDEALCDVNAQVLALNGVQLVHRSSVENGERVGYNCSERGLSQAVQVIGQHPAAKDTIEIFKGEKPPLPNTGAGRLCKLSMGITIQEAVTRVKAHLGLARLRLALATGATTENVITSVAVCAGSGASVLRGVDAQLYVTGELSHHDVLDATHRGATVLLCEHSNTERGYLRTVHSSLQHALGARVRVVISRTDSDPLNIV